MTFNHDKQHHTHIAHPDSVKYRAIGMFEAGMKKRTIPMKFRVPKSLMQLAGMLRDKWNAIPLETINHLIDSMPRRVNAVISA